MRHSVCTIGPAVIDHTGARVLAGPAMEAARALGRDTACPILLTGNDPLQIVAQRLLHDEFGDTGIVVPALQVTQSKGDIQPTWDFRQPVCVDQTLPWEAWKALRWAAVTIITSMPSDAVHMTDDVLKLSAKPVVIFDLPQLGDPLRANEIASQAWLTAITCDQAALWHGTRDPIMVIETLQRLGCHHAAVLDGRVSTVRFQGQWLSHTATEQLDGDILPHLLSEFVRQLRFDMPWQESWSLATQLSSTQSLNRANVDSRLWQSSMEHLSTALQPITATLSTLWSLGRSG